MNALGLQYNIYIMLYIYLLQNQDQFLPYNHIPFPNCNSSFSPFPAIHSISNYLQTKTPSLGIPNFSLANLQAQNGSKQWSLSESQENRPFSYQHGYSFKQNSECSTDKKERKRKNKVLQQKVNKSKQQKKDVAKDSESSKRNSGSNIFRAFIKFCSKSRFENTLKEKFEAIKASQAYSISFEYFTLRVKQIAPSTSNYINLREFKKVCEDMSNFSQIFRRLFHWFVNNNAINHCLTLKGKNRMMKSSIKCFLNNLHTIEEEVWQVANKGVEQ